MTGQFIEADFKNNEDMLMLFEPVFLHLIVPVPAFEDVSIFEISLKLPEVL